MPHEVTPEKGTKKPRSICSAPRWCCCLFGDGEEGKAQNACPASMPVQRASLVEQNTRRMRSAKIKKKSSEAKRVMFDNSKHSDGDCCLRGLGGRSFRNMGFR